MKYLTNDHADAFVPHLAGLVNWCKLCHVTTLCSSFISICAGIKFVSLSTFYLLKKELWILNCLGS